MVSGLRNVPPRLLTHPPLPCATFLALFFAIVPGFAHRLQVGLVPEQRQVAPVRDDMIHHRAVWRVRRADQIDTGLRAFPPGALQHPEPQAGGGIAPAFGIVKAAQALAAVITAALVTACVAYPTTGGAMPIRCGGAFNRPM